LRTVTLGTNKKEIDFFDLRITLSYMEVVMSQTITIRIPENMRKELEELSKSENKPLSDLVRDSLKKFILVYRFRKLRNTVLPFAEVQGILTDEEVFENL